MSALAQTFSDYTRVVPLTIQNNDTVATPTPTSAEVVFPIDAANMRTDRLDVRVGYNNGTSTQEIASKIFRTTPNPTSPWYTENLSAGTTDYSTLPAGTAVNPGTASGDDSGTTVTLPFSFPFAGGSSNQVFMSTDGYLSPGSATPTGQYGRGGTTGGARGIWPYSSDYTTAINGGPTGSALYFYGDATRAVFRWEVAESGKSTIIAKFAAILYPNGDIRFVYSNLVTPTSSGVGGLGSYGEVAYGVQAGYYGAGIIHYPTDNYPTSADFSNHTDILYTALPVVLPTEQVRAVFRLQAPIPAGGTSTGEYAIYYGNTSPLATAQRDLKQVFDTYYDFSNAALGAAADWDVQGANTVTVETYQGRKVGVLRGGFNHAQASLKAGVLPNFLNVEALSHIAGDGGGQLEMGTMVRVISDSSDANFQGGYAYVTDSFGSNASICSYINGNADNGPALMAETPHALQSDVFDNVLFRVNGTPGLLQGKDWMDNVETEPSGWLVQSDRSTATPAHNSVADPAYGAGTIGMSNYVQPFALDYIALRELRNLGVTSGAIQTVTPAGPFIQGTISSTKTSLNPLTTATVTITGPNSYNSTFVVGPSGNYKVSAPNTGTYTVTASAPLHTSTTVSGVTPSASGQTNITLQYAASTIAGVVSDALTNMPFSGMTIVAVDSTGARLGSTTTDTNGAYSLQVLATGTVSIAALGNGFANNDARAGKSDRESVNVVPDTVQTVNLLVKGPNNGDFEIPNAAGTAPEGWTTTQFTAGTPLATYKLDSSQNHTPGGHYSLSVTNPTSQFDAWIPGPPNYQWVPVNPNFNYTVSVWVYFTQAGQRARLRVRTLDRSGTDLNLALPGGNTSAGYITAGAADASSGLQAPVGQWTQVTLTVPANTNLGNLDDRLYAAGPPGGGINTGTIYFDDYTITATPIASATGRVVDQNGNPLAHTIVGSLLDQGFGAPNSLNSPVFTDATGHYTLYASAVGDLAVTAWKLPTPDSTGKIPALGYYGRVDGTASAGTPTALPDLALKPQANAAISVVSVLNSTGGNAETGTAANAVDNNVNTREAAGGTDPHIFYTFDLGSAKPIDQIEVLWEYAYPADCTISVSPDTIGDWATIYDGPNPTPISTGVLPGTVNYSSNSEGNTYVFNFPTPQTVRYIQIENRQYQGSLGNYSLIELRALSTTGTVPFTSADVIRALQIAGGLVTASSADKTRLAVTGGSGVQLQDAVKILRSLSGL
jgi:hypothetical protein